ncbi:glycosyltransferase 87 family protein [Nocardioides baekrokdamisoli]|nr:glycosyltransferase 87 family protein [Nocardioides baekrokdamisoli]
MSAAIGGPRGRHAHGYVDWLPAGAVVLVLTTLTFAVGMLQKTSCATRGWDSGIRYTHLCASEVPGAYAAQGLDHPVLTTYWASVMAQLTRWIHDSTTMFVIVNGVGFALLAVLAAFLLTRVRPDRPWEIAAFAVSPALLLTGLVSWELLAVAAVAAALWAYSRGDLGLTGVAIGLGTAADVYPVALLVALLILSIRRRELGSWAIVTLVAGASWFILNVPAMLNRWDAWKGFWSQLIHHGAGAGSFWLLLQDSSGTSIAPATLNICAGIVLGALLVGILTLGVLAHREPTFAELGLLCVLAVVLVDKVYAPQYVLWLLPLAVLARPRWRDQLAWQGAEVLFFCATAWNLAGLMSSGDGPAAMYDITIAIRLCAEIGLGGAVVFSLLRPQTMTVSSNVVVV